MKIRKIRVIAVALMAVMVSGVETRPLEQETRPPLAGPALQDVAIFVS